MDGRRSYTKGPGKDSTPCPPKPPSSTSPQSENIITATFSERRIPLNNNNNNKGYLNLYPFCPIYLCDQKKKKKKKRLRGFDMKKKKKKQKRSFSLFLFRINRERKKRKEKGSIGRSSPVMGSRRRQGSLNLIKPGIAFGIESPPTFRSS